MSKPIDGERSLGFDILRIEHPAIFRFSGMFFKEEFDIDTGYCRFVEIGRRIAEYWCERSLN